MAGYFVSQDKTLEDYFMSTVFFSTVLTTSVVLLHLAFLKLVRRMMDARLAKQHASDLEAFARDSFNDHVGGTLKLKVVVKGTRLKVRIISATSLSDPAKRGKSSSDAYVVVKGQKVDEDDEEVVLEGAELGRTIPVRSLTSATEFRDKPIVVSEEHTSCTEWVCEVWDADLQGHNEFLGQCAVKHEEHSQEESGAHGEEDDVEKEEEKEGEEEHAAGEDRDGEDESPNNKQPRAGAWMRAYELVPQHIDPPSEPEPFVEPPILMFPKLELIFGVLIYYGFCQVRLPRLVVKFHRSLCHLHPRTAFTRTAAPPHSPGEPGGSWSSELGFPGSAIRFRIPDRGWSRHAPLSSRVPGCLLVRVDLERHSEEYLSCAVRAGQLDRRLARGGCGRPLQVPGVQKGGKRVLGQPSRQVKTARAPHERQRCEWRGRRRGERRRCDEEGID